MARPARAREVGETFLSREVVEAVSAVCSAKRRESWSWAKVVGFMAVDGDMVDCEEIVSKVNQRSRRTMIMCSLHNRVQSAAATTRFHKVNRPVIQWHIP